MIQAYEILKGELGKMFFSSDTDFRDTIASYEEYGESFDGAVSLELTDHQ